MLPKKKLVNKRLFQEILENNQIKHGDFFIFKYLQNNKICSNETHLACVVAKGLAKKAVLRNKLRRRVYSILRNFTFKQGCGVFFYKKNGINASFQEIKIDIEKILKKSNFI